MVFSLPSNKHRRHRGREEQERLQTRNGAEGSEHGRGSSEQPKATSSPCSASLLWRREQGEKGLRGRFFFTRPKFTTGTSFQYPTILGEAALTLRKGIVPVPVWLHKNHVLHRVTTAGRHLCGR